MEGPYEGSIQNTWLVYHIRYDEHVIITDLVGELILDDFSLPIKPQDPFFPPSDQLSIPLQQKMSDVHSKVCCAFQSKSFIEAHGLYLVNASWYRLWLSKINVAMDLSSIGSCGRQMKIWFFWRSRCLPLCEPFTPPSSPCSGLPYFFRGI